MESAVVVRAAPFLAEHAAEPIRLADVADHVGYSPFHLARGFQRSVGVPPGRFLAAHRFQLAKRLLLDHDDRVIDVCHASGFTAPGTFAWRFTALVGTSPTEFRRLPHTLAGSPPRPVVVPGSGGPAADLVCGRIELTEAASQLLGPSPSVYVGLFPRRSARGSPVAGALLAGPGEFFLPRVPRGTFWLLASALARSAAYDVQLVPPQTVAGTLEQPVRSCASGRTLRRDLLLDVLPEWSTPVLVALPWLACPSAQDRR